MVRRSRFVDPAKRGLGQPHSRASPWRSAARRHHEHPKADRLPPQHGEEPGLPRHDREHFRERGQPIYEGTRKGLQELYAQILDNSEAALWKWTTLEKCRKPDEPDRSFFTRIVIAVDPAVTTEEDSDETGIVIAGLGEDGQVYVLEDLSGHWTPLEWAKLVLGAYSRWQADAVIAETNQGGDLVEANLSAHAEDEFFSFKGVYAKRGKYLRAEPVAAYYEKGKVHHVGRFDKLEKQMTDFVGSTTRGSPDRLDALVYAVGELMLGSFKHAFW